MDAALACNAVRAHAPCLAAARWGSADGLGRYGVPASPLRPRFPSHGRPQGRRPDLVDGSCVCGLAAACAGRESLNSGRRGRARRAGGAGRPGRSEVLPNGASAAAALRRWRQKTGPAPMEEDLPAPSRSSNLKSWRGNRWRLSEKSMPSCVATWHSWMKSMDSEQFFETVSQRPQLLPSYLEQAKEEGMAGPGNDVCVQTAEFVLKHLPVGCRRLVDLGCGDATLAAELQSRGASVKVTNVDAARLAPGVVVQNLGALPGDWSGRFEAAVLCRALWSLDPLKVLKEAHRVLEPSPRSRLVVVEPFRRWWRPKDHEDTCQQPQNQLINALERAGFYIFKDQSVNIEGDPEGLPGKSFMKGVFQYVLASPKRDTRDATS
ncbi:unnamed protein product [Durusdinium trenchii]|uniref:Ribosomal RNA-processing protein 8 n=1 Tax=Durusdinium trenchii TaxID=1381693 RepID=A0ABP0J0Z3_9DINO